MMPTGSDLAWAIAAAAFSAGWGLTAYFARRERAGLQSNLERLGQRIDGLVASLDGLRSEIHRMGLEHERRLVRLETLLGETDHLRHQQ